MSEKIQELSKKFDLAGDEPVFLEMTYAGLFEVLGDMVIRNVLPHQWISKPTLIMIQTMFEKLIERFERESFPSEFLMAWEYYQGFDAGEGGLKH